MGSFWESILDMMGGDDHQVFGVDEDFNAKEAEENYNQRNNSSSDDE